MSERAKRNAASNFQRGRLLQQPSMKQESQRTKFAHVGRGPTKHWIRVYTPDGKWLASASWDGTALVWEIPSGRQAILIDTDRVSCVDFTLTGDLVTANWDGTVHLWDLAALKK
jgi:WD40 repeat protein